MSVSRRLVMAFALLVGMVGGAAFGVLAIHKADRRESPAATDLGSLSAGGWSTTRPPTVAVTDGGTIYVLWAQPGRRQAVLPKGVPRIPDEFSFGPAKDPRWSTAPAVSVCRRGKWSRPGLLVDGL